MDFTNKHNICSLATPQIVNIELLYLEMCPTVSCPFRVFFLLTLNVFQLSSFPSDEVLKTIIRLKFAHKSSACVENKLSEKKVRIVCFSHIFLYVQCFKIGVFCMVWIHKSPNALSLLCLFFECMQCIC